MSCIIGVDVSVIGSEPSCDLIRSMISVSLFLVRSASMPGYGRRIARNTYSGSAPDFTRISAASQLHTREAQRSGVPISHRFPESNRISLFGSAPRRRIWRKASRLRDHPSPGGHMAACSGVAHSSFAPC